MSPEPERYPPAKVRQEKDAAEARVLQLVHEALQRAKARHAEQS